MSFDRNEYERKHRPITPPNRRRSPAQERWERPRSVTFYLQCECGITRPYQDVSVSHERFIVDAWVAISQHWYECTGRAKVTMQRIGRDDFAVIEAWDTWYDVKALREKLAETLWLGLPVDADRVARTVAALRIGI